jgi:hypothetical protein
MARDRLRAVSPNPTLAVVSACLWDLRAQCEEQLRRLTEAQRVTEAYRDSGSPRRSVKLRLQAEIEQVLNANGVIRQAAQECAKTIGQLPEVDPPPV